MILTDILLIILILAISILCIILIIFLKEFVGQVESIQIDFHEFVEKAKPVISNIEEVTHRVNRVVSDVEKYWEEIDNFIKNARERISIIKIPEDIPNVLYPVKYLVKNIKAISSGLSAFWNDYKL